MLLILKLKSNLRMNIFIVNQNPDSFYNDVEGEHYDYPSVIPNGRQIKVGDYLILIYLRSLRIKRS